MNRIKIVSGMDDPFFRYQRSRSDTLASTGANSTNPSLLHTPSCTVCNHFGRSCLARTSLQVEVEGPDDLIQQLSRSIRQGQPLYNASCSFTKCTEEGPWMILVIIYCILFILSAFPMILYAFCFCKCDRCTSRRQGGYKGLGVGATALRRQFSLFFRRVGLTRRPPYSDPSETEPTCLQRVCRQCSYDEEGISAPELPPAHQML